MRRGFLYLVVIMDWATRKVLAWRLSNTLEADFCVEALNEALSTISSWNGCGARSNMSASICMRGAVDGRLEPASANGQRSTINGGRIPLLADERPMLFTGLEIIRSNPTGRRDL